MGTHTWWRATIVNSVLWFPRNLTHTIRITQSDRRAWNRTECTFGCLPFSTSLSDLPGIAIWSDENAIGQVWSVAHLTAENLRASTATVVAFLNSIEIRQKKYGHTDSFCKCTRRLLQQKLQKQRRSGWPTEDEHNLLYPHPTVLSSAYSFGIFFFLCDL